MVRRAFLLGLYELRYYFYTRLYLLKALDNDFLPRFDSRIDDPEIADPLAGLYRALLHSRVGFYNHDAIEPLPLLHRELGRKQGVLP